MGENAAYFRVDPQKKRWWPSFLSNQINSLTFFNNVQSFNGNIWESYIFREEMETKKPVFLSLPPLK